MSLSKEEILDAIAEMSVMDVVALVGAMEEKFGVSAAAAVAGFMAGLLGVGGGIIMVPALYYAFTVLDFDIVTRMHLSVGTSLAIIIPTSIISTKTHMEYDAVAVSYTHLRAHET